ncbi:MAG: histidine phosphatase family protein [Pseudomonadota bacterium]
MTRWWWVRHGPTHAKAAIGWTDLPADLSDAPRLARLSAALPDAPILTSDLTRAVATGDAIADARPRLGETQALREIHYGAWEGLPFGEIAERWPDLSRAYWSDPGDVAPPEGESWTALAARVEGEIEARNGTHQDIIVVAHMGVILAALAHASGLPPARALSFEIANLSLTRLDWLGEHGWRIGCVNHTP